MQLNKSVSNVVNLLCFCPCVTPEHFWALQETITSGGDATLHSHGCKLGSF